MKRILLLLAITLTILTLASCSGNGIDVPTGESEQTEQNASDNAVSECEHEYEEKILVAATCAKNGITKKTCKLCKKSENVTVAKTAHVEVTDKGTAATCTAPGTTDGKHCSVCNTVTVAQAPIAALGHTEVTDSAVAATCTTPGKTEGKHCSVCNTVTVVQAPIAALGHTEVTDPAVAATCTTPGKTEGKHCSVCNTVTLAQAPTTGQHNIIQRTREALTCTKNGVVENYCTECKTVIDTTTIPKGHYPVDHEYTQITHPQIGALCEGFAEGEQCLQCSTCFIAPGTYTISGRIRISESSWTGTENFSFSYLGNDNKKYSATKFIISQGEYYDNIISFDSVQMQDFYSCIITITEPYFAEVSEWFYNDIFLKYFEKGEYTLSGDYEFNESMYYCLTSIPNGLYNLEFKYFFNGTEYSSSFIQIIDSSDSETVMNYSTRANVATYLWKQYDGSFNENISRSIVFETPQTVSKEFFEWFTDCAAKY